MFMDGSWAREELKTTTVLDSLGCLRGPVQGQLLQIMRRMRWHTMNTCVMERSLD